MRKIYLILALVILVFPVIVQSRELSLRFSYVIDDGSQSITPDIFIAVGSEDEIVTDTLDIKDLRQPPPPPARDYARITTTDSGIELIKDCRPFEPNMPDLSYSIELSAYDDGGLGLTGSAVFTLINPEGLSDLQPDSMVYLRRYDSGDNFVRKYDLRDPNNYTIEWPVTNAQGMHGTMELVVIDKCLAANLDGFGPVNLKDYSFMTDLWNQAGTFPDGDIDGDGLVDVNDLSIMAEKWLSYCVP